MSLNVTNLDELTTDCFIYLTSDAIEGLPEFVINAGGTGRDYAVKVESPYLKNGTPYSIIQTLIDTKNNIDICVRSKHLYSIVDGNPVRLRPDDPTSEWSEWSLLINNNMLNEVLRKNDEWHGRQTEINTLSSGQLQLMRISGREKFQRFVYSSDSITEVYTGDEGTGYIKCPPYLVFNFKDSEARLLVYFYTKNGTSFDPRWDILNLRDSASDTVNYLSLFSCCNRVIAIPDGTYVKFSLAVPGEVEVYGWSGQHFGPEQSGTTYTPNVRSDTLADETYATNYTGLTVPGKARMIICKDFSAAKVYGYPHGSNTKEVIALNNKTVPYFGCFDLPEGYDYFRICLAKSEWISNKAEPVRSPYVGAVNLNDNISLLYLSSEVKDQNFADVIIRRAKKLTDFTWVSKDNRNTWVPGRQYKEGTMYNGIPYTSRWGDIQYVGWHISMHTYVNALNDELSRFHVPPVSSQFAPFGYGTVCSAFATLCAGYPYPVTTYGLLHDPQTEHRISFQPEIGSIASDGKGHCIIFESIGTDENSKSMTIYESVPPVTTRRTLYNIQKNGGGRTVYSYLFNQKYYTIHKNATIPYQQYDLDDTEIIGGSARPYVGDRGVCTNLTGIKVNIKDSSALILYIKRFSYSDGTGEFTATEDQADAVPINGEAQIDVPTNGRRDGFYGFYTDKDPVTEYIEYRNVTVKRYKQTDKGLLMPDDDWWYALWGSLTTAEKQVEIIPNLSNPILNYGRKYTYEDYRASGYTPKKTEEHNEPTQPASADDESSDENISGEGSANGSGFLFYKGILGAYCVPLIHDDSFNNEKRV